MKKFTKAIGFDKFGSPEVFEEREIEIQFDESNNVLLRIDRVGINPANALVRGGKFGANPVINGFQIIGGEIQGTVVDLFGSVSGLNIGDKVIARTLNGSYAEYIATNESNIYKIPENMSLDFAAGFSATALTAYRALHGGFITLKEGGTLAILGAAGSVGTFLIQLAKPFNVNIIAIASAKNEEKLKELGANTFIDYNNPDQVKDWENKADWAIDASLFSSGQQIALKLLKDKGTYLGLASLPSDTLNKELNLVMLTGTPLQETKEAMTYLFDFYSKYGLTLNIAYKLPLTLEGVKEAHYLIEKKDKSGKTILVRED